MRALAGKTFTKHRVIAIALLSVALTFAILQSHSILLVNAAYSFYVMVSLLSSLLMGLTYCVYKCWQELKFEKTIDWIFAAIAMLISAFTVFYNIDAKTMWLDEFTTSMTFMKANGEFWPRIQEIVKHTLTQAQTPFIYLFNAAGIALAGETVLGYRLHSTVFGILSVGLFYRCLRFVIPNTILSFVFSMALALNFYFIYYSQEARPYTGAIFFQLVYLTALYIFYTKKFSYQRTALLFVSQSLFLFSLGLQAPIVFLGLSTCLSAALYWQKSKKFVPYLAISLASAILYFPHQFSALKFHSGRYIVAQVHNKTQSILYGFSEALILKYFLAVMLVGFIVYFKNNLKLKKNSSADNYAALLTGGTLLFVIGIFILFNSVINNMFHARYGLLILPMAYLVAFYFLYKIILAVYYKKTLSLFALCLAVSLLAIDLPKNFFHLRMHYLNEHTGNVPQGLPWKKIYAQIDNSAKEGDFLISFSISKIQADWALNAYLLNNVYLKRNKSFVTQDWDKQSIMEFIAKIKKEDVDNASGFVVLHSLRNAFDDYQHIIEEVTATADSIKSARVILESEGQAVLVRVGHKEGEFLIALESYLLALLRHLPPDYLISPRLYLAELYLWQGRVDEAITLIEQIDESVSGKYVSKYYAYRIRKIHRLKKKATREQARTAKVN